MKRRYNSFTIGGALLYIIYTLMNRYIVEIPNIAAIPVMIVSIILIIVGIVKSRINNH